MFQMDDWEGGMTVVWVKLFQVPPKRFLLKCLLFNFPPALAGFPRWKALQPEAEIGVLLLCYHSPRRRKRRIAGPPVVRRLPL